MFESNCVVAANCSRIALEGFPFVGDPAGELKGNGFVPRGTLVLQAADLRARLTPHHHCLALVHLLRPLL